MATRQTRKPREAELTDEQKARVEALRARHRTPEARAEEARVREALEREYRETGTAQGHRRRDDDGRTGGVPPLHHVAAPRAGTPGALPVRRGRSRRDRQGGPEPPRERPAAQPHGEYPGPVRATPSASPSPGGWSKRKAAEARTCPTDRCSARPAGVGAIAGGPDGSGGRVRETLPVAATAATIDRAWNGRGQGPRPAVKCAEMPAWNGR